jgi:hypothetical protein
MGEPEEPEAAAEVELQDLPPLVDKAEEERSFCIGRSETLCLVIF